MASSLWRICDFYDRPEGFAVVRPIPTKAIMDVCELYGATLEDFEKVLFIEGIVYPILVERAKDARGKDKGRR